MSTASDTTNTAITAAPTSIESIGITSSARAEAKYQVYRPFSGNRSGGQVETVSITGRATQEIAGLREKYNIGAVVGAAIDASGTPQPTLKQCQPRIAHSGAA